MKTAIISSTALVALATAAPMNSNSSSGTTSSSGKSLAPIMYIDGQQVNLNGGPTAIKGVCSANDDVYTCAQKTAAQWKLSSTGSSSMGHMTVEEACFFPNGTAYNCQIDFDYHIGFTDCHLSDPIIVDHQDLFDCNVDGGCKESFTFTTSSTQMIMDAMQVGVSVNAGFNIGFFSASVGVTTDWMHSWSNSTTYESSITREYDLAAGDVCAPTSIQFNTQCTAGLVVDNPRSPGMATATMQGSEGISTLLFYPCQQVANPVFTVSGDDKWNAICQAMTSSGLAMDVDSLGGGSSWAIQGCMAS
jgi:hypothetical protein